MNDLTFGQFLGGTAIVFFAFGVLGAILGIAEKWGRR